MMSASRNKQQNYFQLLKPIPHTPLTPSKKRTGSFFEKKTLKILKNNKYVYMDLFDENQDQGIKEMQRINPETIARQEYQKIGQHEYISDFKNLSPLSQKSIDYLEKDSEYRKQKQQLKKLFKKKLDEKRRNSGRMLSMGKNKKHQRNSSFNFAGKQQILGDLKPKQCLSMQHSPQIKRSFVTKTINHNTINEQSEDGEAASTFRNIQPYKLKRILLKKELSEMSGAIIEREKQLIRKFGLTNQYQSITHKRSPIVRNKDARKIYLPGIKSDYGFSY